ncbi:MAG: DNA cytosine methyltransferase [Betaproteobacteria bacterium]
MNSKNGNRPICIDLFAGAGGLALGFEQAGFDVAAAVEYDPIHAAIHKLNFPESEVICQDVRKITGDEIRRRAGLGARSVEVVVGGPPCQGFSLIGYRVLDDPRNELVFHFWRIMTELRPKAFVFENVAGMATGPHQKLLEELIQRFEGSGYKVHLPYRVLNAGHFGVPQDRRRLILLGARHGLRVPKYPAPRTAPPNGKGQRSGELVKGLDPTPTVREAIGDLPDIEQFEGLLNDDIMNPVKYGRGSTYGLRLRGQSGDPTDFSYPRVADWEGLSGCLRAEHTDESRRRFADTAPGTVEPISRFLRLDPAGLCNTLRAGTATDRGAFTSPRPIHPTLNRCISVREAARLHSYPDWFRFHKTIWHGFRQIGNSVPPLLGRAIGEAVVEALGLKQVKPKRTVRLGREELARLTMKEAAAAFGVRADVIPARQRKASAR